MKIRITIYAIAVALLGGCASSREHIKNEIPVPLGKAQYVVPGAVVGTFNEQTILSKYADAVLIATKYRLAYRDRNNNILGVKTEMIPDGIKVGYLHQATPTLYHDYYATFGAKASYNGQAAVLDITCPQTMVQDNKNFLGNWKPFVSVDEAVSDVGKICKEARLVFNKRESGEVNVNFGDSAVYANFARKLKAANLGKDEIKKDDIAKYRWFEVQDGNISRKLGVTVYPYRSGSKVTYVWENEIVCKANAGCNYDSTSAKRMNDTVATIAND